MSSLTSPGLKACADKTIVALRPYLERLGGCALDLSGDFLGRTKYVSVPVVAGAAETFATGSSGNYNHTTGTLKYVDVNCATHKKCTFELTDLDCLEIEDGPMWNTFAKASADKIGPEIVKSALGLLVYGSRQGTVTLSSVTLANVANVAAKVIEAGYDPALCTLYLEPTTFYSLIALLPQSAVSGDIMKSARIDGALFGFASVQAAPNIAKADAAATNYGLGFVVPNGAIAVAARIPKPPKGGEGYVEIGTQTDEVTGFTLGLRVHVDPSEGKTFLNVESLYGCALTKANSNGAPGFLQVVSQ